MSAASASHCTQDQAFAANPTNYTNTNIRRIASANRNSTRKKDKKVNPKEHAAGKVLIFLNLIMFSPIILVEKF